MLEFQLFANFPSNKNLHFATTFTEAEIDKAEQVAKVKPSLVLSSKYYPRT